MKIAFIANHDKTVFFHGVASRLEAEGHEVFWLSPSHTWASWLLAQGTRPERVLDITLHCDEWAPGTPVGADELAHLNALERLTGQTVNDVIMMDRLLSLRPRAHALAYLAACRRHLERFLGENRIQVVFCEATWAFELLAIQICAKLGIRSLLPQATRIPDHRFAFFEGPFETRFVPIGTVTPEHAQQAEVFYREFLEKKPRPAYFYLNNKIPAPRLEWVRKLARNVRRAQEDPRNETRFSPSWLITKRLSELWNTWQTRRANPFEKPSATPEKPFVLFTLHKQPESSIDVLGSYYSNQVELIRAVARSIPATHELYVKEHSNAIGDRSPSVYEEIRRIPGVRLVDPFMNSFDLLRTTDLVVTVSGTIAYEAGILGVPAITLAPMFFGDLLHASGVNPFDPGRNGIRTFFEGAAPSSPEEQAARVTRFLATLYANSCPGLIGDPVSDARCTLPENLDEVAKGFERLLAACSTTAVRA